jgi:predicted O-methyltransferase YrrM
MSRVRSQAADNYMAVLFAHEDKDLVRAAAALKADGKFGINVGSAEGKILQFLCKMAKAKTVVEIGTLYAYSTLWMAKALPEDGKIHSVEFNPEHFSVASKIVEASDVAQKIKLYLGDAKKILSDIKLKPDLVFIDADKGGYGDYLRWAMENVSVGGLIIGDNTFLFGAMFGEDRGENVTAKAKEAMTYFNETLAKHPDYFSLMLPTYEGMTVGLKIR